jgi:hypothetical protein
VLLPVDGGLRRDVQGLRIDFAQRRHPGRRGERRDFAERRRTHVGGRERRFVLIPARALRVAVEGEIVQRAAARNRIDADWQRRHIAVRIAQRERARSGGLWRDGQHLLRDRTGRDAGVAGQRRAPCRR